MFPYFPENYNLSYGTSGRTSENRGSNVQSNSFPNARNQQGMYNSNGFGGYSYMGPRDFIEPLCSVPISGRINRNQMAPVNQSPMQAATVSVGSSSAPSIADYDSQDLISVLSHCYSADPHGTLELFNTFLAGDGMGDMVGQVQGGQETWLETSIPAYNNQSACRGLDGQATWPENSLISAYNNQLGLQGIDGQAQGGQATWPDDSLMSAYNNQDRHAQGGQATWHDPLIPAYNIQQPQQDSLAFYSYPSPVSRPSTITSSTSTYESSECDTSSEGQNSSWLYERSYVKTTINTGKVSASYGKITNSGTIDIGRLARSFQHAGLYFPPGFFFFPELSSRFRQQAMPGDTTEATEILFAVGDCPGVRLVDLCEQQVTIRDAERKLFEESGLKRIPFIVTFPGLEFPKNTLAIRTKSPTNEYFTRGELAFNIACVILDYLKKLRHVPPLSGYKAPYYEWDYKKVDINRLYIFSIYRLRNLGDKAYDGAWCPSIGLRT